MEISFKKLEEIINLSSYKTNGSGTEKNVGYLLADLFPNSEVFWKKFIIPFTNRIDDSITDEAKSIESRDGVSVELYDIGSFHYTVFHNFLYAYAALYHKQRQTSYFENFYTHLSTICDCAEEFLVLIHRLLLECNQSESNLLQELSEDDFLEICKKWYTKNYSTLYELYLSKGKYKPISIPTRLSLIKEYFENSDAWQNYYTFSKVLKQYRNIIVHHYTIAFFIGDDGIHYVPKKEKIAEYKRWKDLDKAKNDPMKLQSDFISRDFQMSQDLSTLQSLLQDLWNKPIADMTKLFQEKNQVLFKKYNIVLT